MKIKQILKSNRSQKYDSQITFTVRSSTKESIDKTLNTLAASGDIDVNGVISDVLDNFVLQVNRKPRAPSSRRAKLSAVKNAVNG